MKDKRETSTVVVKKILNPLSKEDEQKIREHISDKHNDFEARCFDGYVLRDDGGLFILDEEGVGNEEAIMPGEKNALVVDVYPKNEGFIAIAPVLQIGFSYEEVLAMETEDVALHDFIRKFGGRLECNYSLWKSKLEEVPA
jgi:hypothetical protein